MKQFLPALCKRTGEGIIIKVMKIIKPTSFGTESPMKEWYPSISFSSKDLPEIKKWQIGKKYKVVLEIEEKSVRKDEKEFSASFDIKKVGLVNNPETSKKKYKVLFK
jgi:hypothetical protein